MKIYSLFSAALLALFIVQADTDADIVQRYQVDEIIVIIYHANGNVPILRSDIRPSIDGRPRNLRDILVEELLILDGKKLKIEVSEADIDRFLGQLQKANGVSLDAIQQLFKEMGYTLEEGRAQLKRNQMISEVVEFRIKGQHRMVIEPAVIEEYYTAHPEYHEPRFTLVQAVVPHGALTRADLEKRIAEKSQEFVWQEPFTVLESELPEEKQFIKAHNDGDIVTIEEGAEGFEITKLVHRQERTLISLDERRDMISGEIRKQRFLELRDEFFKKLLSEAHMKFTHATDRAAVLG